MVDATMDIKLYREQGYLYPFTIYSEAREIR